MAVAATATTSPPFTITITEAQATTITTLITTIGEQGWLSLIGNSMSLYTLGGAIASVPPLQFAAYIVTDCALKEHLRAIRQDRYKWPFIVNGFGNNMKKEAEEGRLSGQLPGFATFVGKDEKVLGGYANEKAWDQFFCALL